MTSYIPQELQQKYERWRELYQVQRDAQQHWQEAEVLFEELQTYYQSEQWQEDHQSNLSLEYSGKEHSILSEDTLWNMIADREELSIHWMQLSLKAIEKK